LPFAFVLPFFSPGLRAEALLDTKFLFSFSTSSQHSLLPDKLSPEASGGGPVSSPRPMSSSHFPSPHPSNLNETNTFFPPHLSRYFLYRPVPSKHPRLPFFLNLNRPPQDCLIPFPGSAVRGFCSFSHRFDFSWPGGCITFLAVCRSALVLGGTFQGLATPFLGLSF